MKQTIEGSYLELIRQDQQQNRTKATNLPILGEKAKTNIAEASKYSGYFSNPITKDFMKRYILSKLEFPTTLGCLAQSITELNMRVDNLHTDAYSYKKAKIEAHKEDIKVRRLEKKIAECQDPLDKEDLLCDIETAKIERDNKQDSLNKIQLAAMARYQEAMGWKECVEDYMKEGGYKHLDEVPWGEIRMIDMAAKTEKWGELEAKGMLEMTPSKLAIVLDSPEEFRRGFVKGLLSQPDGMQKAIQMGLIEAPKPAAVPSPLVEAPKS